jgi:hypothetical protein
VDNGFWLVIANGSAGGDSSPRKKHRTLQVQISNGRSRKQNSVEASCVRRAAEGMGRAVNEEDGLFKVVTITDGESMKAYRMAPSLSSSLSSPRIL